MFKYKIILQIPKKMNSFYKCTGKNNILITVSFVLMT